MKIYENNPNFWALKKTPIVRGILEHVQVHSIYQMLQSYNLRCFKWFSNPPLDNQFLWQNISTVHYLHQFPKSCHVGWFLLGTFLRDSGRSFLKPLLSCHHVGIKIYPAGWKIHRILDGYFAILPGKNHKFSLPVEMLVYAGGYTPEI